MTRHELGTVCVQGGWRPKNGEPCQLIGIGKTLLERKLSGVFEHRVVRRSSMLVSYTHLTLPTNCTV